MRENSTGACPAPEQKVATYDSGSQLLNISQKYRSQKSKQRVAYQSGIDICVGLLAGGQSVPETFITSRYRADGIKTIRMVHRKYPDATRLEIKNGLWILSPIIGGMTCE